MFGNLCTLSFLFPNLVSFHREPDSNERHCFTRVFHCILQRCCFSSFSFFIVILHAFCEGHCLEDGKSLKMLVTKGVLENTSLDNGRIEVHPMNPRETFAIYANARAVDGPLEPSLSKHRTKDNWTGGAMLLS